MDPKKESLRKIPTIHAPSTAGDIGSVLKAARQKKGVSIDAVAQQTRIPKKYLEAMENNRTDELPALVYLRGFLKGYCDHLEVEFEPLWKMLQPAPAPTPAPLVAAAEEAAEPAPAVPAHAKEEQPAPAPSAHAPAAAPKRAEPRVIHHDDGRRDFSGPIAIVASCAVAIAIFLWLKKQDSKPPEVAHEAPAVLAPVVSESGAELALTFNEAAWISLKADGVTVYEGLVPKGAQQKWKSKRTFALRTPSPQNLALQLNGKPAALPEPTEGEYRFE